MLIMTQDRISGLATEKSPLSTYGPGNTRDESNRNSWVSSDGDDKLTINCFGQVNGLFLGRYQADSVKLTYQGDEIFSKKTSSGFISVGYSNGASGVVTGEVDSISEITYTSTGGDYFYKTGTLITFKLNLDSTYINVNDIITVTNLHANLNGLHRVVQVQQDTSFTRLNSSGNSKFFQQSGQIGSKIQVIVNQNKTTVDGYLTVGDTLSIENGASIPLIAGLIVDEDDINFSYSIKFAHNSSYLLKSGDSPFTVDEYISFTGVSLYATSDPSLISENMDFATNSYKTYYVTAVSAGESSFTVFVNPSTYFASSLVTVNTTSSLTSFGSSFYYSGGGYQHRLGLSLITGTTLSTGSEEYSNDEVLEFSLPVISSVSLNAAQLTLNSIEQTKLHKTFIKSRSDFSVKLPFKLTSFLFAANDSIELRKYVVDTEDASTTREGVGTPIRRIDVATRTQNTVGDFVSGKLIRVESNYIPLPREAFPTRITIEMDATLNHNAANLFDQFLLEEVTIENPVTEATLTTVNSSDYGNYKTDIATYQYNGSDNGELTLYVTANTTIELNDYIYLNWPNNVPAQNNQISKTILSSTSGTTFRVTTPIHELYEGMQVNGTNNTYIASINTTTNEIITNISIANVTPGTTVTFDHHPNLGSEAHNSWKGFHRVISSENNGSTLKVVVPNVGTKGDLTINNNAYLQSGFNATASSAYITKVSNGKGRFVRPITSSITQADFFLWNSDSTNSVEYTYTDPVTNTSKTVDIAAKTARLVFASAHSLVNNDKIVLYDVLNATNAANMKGLNSSYLVTYTTSNEVAIEIAEASAINISSFASDSTNVARLVIITNGDHGFSVGDKVSLNKMPTIDGVVQNGVFTIERTPSSKSFTVILTNPSNVDVTDETFPITVPAGCQAISGVHNLAFGSTHTTNSTSSLISSLKTSRSVSISDSISAFEVPIQVGNLLYRDSLQYSSSQYEAVNDVSAKFTKTPNIDDAASTLPYRPDSDTAIQNTFAGTAKSIISQINLIIGDATSEFNIHLVKPFGILGEPYSFTKLLQSLRVAIVRAGVSRTLPNPQVGVANNFKDYSVRKELPTGAYYYLNRDSAKEFSGRIISDPDSVDLLVDFGAEQLARPFPCLVISGNKGNMPKLRTKTALYGYFTALPTASYSNKLVNLKEASFSIREVL